jgi:hypothetical protein
MGFVNFRKGLEPLDSGALQRSVDALEAVDELLGERFAGFCPEEAAADAAVLFDGEGEGEEHLDILLDVLGGAVVEVLVVYGFGEPGGVEAEVDADVAVLFEGGVVESGAEAEDSDGGGLPLPEGVEANGFEVGVDADASIAGLRINGFGGPELPTHLELVGGVVVELLGGLSHGVFDDGFGGFLGAIVVDVEALVGGGFVEADGVGAGGRYTGVSADEGELAHDRDEGRGEVLEAEVGEPET